MSYEEKQIKQKKRHEKQGKLLIFNKMPAKPYKSRDSKHFSELKYTVSIPYPHLRIPYRYNCSVYILYNLYTVNIIR